jgi:hypothetical protein
VTCRRGLDIDNECVVEVGCLLEVAGGIEGELPALFD